MSMNRARVILRVGGLVPLRLRALRARLLLDHYAERMGVEEVQCPACAGAGRLDGRMTRHCPICGGFALVPESLAFWFGQAMAAAASLSGRQLPRALRALSVAPAMRYGRCAEALARVSREDGFDWSAILGEGSCEPLAVSIASCADARR